MLIEEFILDYIGTPELKNNFLVIKSTIKRINKTHQSIVGWGNLKKPFDDSYSVLVSIFYRDSGGWKNIFNRNMTNLCSQLTKQTGLWSQTAKQYCPGIFGNKCPFNIGNYSCGPVILARYRKDWSRDLQLVIPPMLPGSGGDQHRFNLTLMDSNGHIVQTVQINVRLVNEFSSNQ